MKYISTRGHAPALNFEEVLLTGLAADGGLYVPETLPVFERAEIASMAAMDYPTLAAHYSPVCRRLHSRAGPG